MFGDNIISRVARINQVRSRARCRMGITRCRHIPNVDPKLQQFSAEIKHDEETRKSTSNCFGKKNQKYDPSLSFRGTARPQISKSPFDLRPERLGPPQRPPTAKPATAAWGHSIRAARESHVRSSGMARKEVKSILFVHHSTDPTPPKVQSPSSGTQGRCDLPLGFAARSQARRVLTGHPKALRDM